MLSTNGHVAAVKPKNPHKERKDDAHKKSFIFP
jgi:hypothetical protein